MGWFMIRHSMFLGLALLSGAGSAAPDRAKSPLPRVFLSPAGQPFRAFGGPYPSHTWFEQADANHDGMLTAEEMIADGDQFFKTLDVDEDGLIAGQEIKRYEQEVAPEISMGTSTPMGPPPGMGGMSGMPPGGHPGGGMPGGMPGAGSSPTGSLMGGPRPRDFSSMPRGGALFSFFNIPHPILRADLDVSFTVSRDELRKWVNKQFIALDQGHKGHLLLADLPRTPIQRIGARRGKMRR